MSVVDDLSVVLVVAAVVGVTWSEATTRLARARARHSSASDLPAPAVRPTGSDAITRRSPHADMVGARSH